MIISTHQASALVRNGVLLVRQYGDDGTQYADLPRLPRTALERQRAAVVSDNGRRYLALDNCGTCTVDHVAINW